MSRDESVVTGAALPDPKLAWNCLRVVDLSYNDLMEIDQSMVSMLALICQKFSVRTHYQVLCAFVQLLLRNVEELKLSHNKIKCVEHLSVSLPYTYIGIGLYRAVHNGDTFSMLNP